MSTIDEALEKIEKGKEPASQEKQIKKVETDAFQVLKSYPWALYNYYDKNHQSDFYHKFDFRAVEALAEYIRFKPDCELTMVTTSDEILNIIEANNHDFKNLLTETDFKGCIPDPFFMADDESYKDIPFNSDLKTILNYQELKNFKKAAKDYFIIPDLAFLSLFIEEGEKLRRYVQETENVGEKILVIDGDASCHSRVHTCDFEPFTIEKLSKFYKATGIKEVKNMMSQVAELRKMLKDWNWSHDAESVQDELFKRLQRYNPSLTI